MNPLALQEQAWYGFLSTKYVNGANSRKVVSCVLSVMLLLQHQRFNTVSDLYDPLAVPQHFTCRQ